MFAGRDGASARSRRGGRWSGRRSRWSTRVVGQRLLELGGPGEAAAFLRDRFEFGGAAAHQQGLGHDGFAIAERDAALLHDGVERAAQVLVESHAPGDAVHDDADVVNDFLAHVCSVRGQGFSVHCGWAPSGSAGTSDSGARQGAVEFLAPVGDIARRAVAVNHAHRRAAGVGQLVEDGGRDDIRPVRSGPRCFSSPRHISPVAFDDEVDLFLLLVVPGHLSAVRLEGDVAHGEILVAWIGLMPPTRFCVRRLRRVRPPGDLREVGDDHRRLL